jgi:SAM-dependent methyltransferase
VAEAETKMRVFKIETPSEPGEVRAESANPRDDMGTESESELARMREALSAASERAASLERTLDIVLASRSWRLTRPYRWIGGLISGRRDVRPPFDENVSVRVATADGRVDQRSPSHGVQSSDRASDQTSSSTSGRGQVMPRVNYYHLVPYNGGNVFRQKFGSLSDEAWCQLLVQSITEPVMENVQFPLFPDNELQERVQGSHGAHSLGEAAQFYKFVKANTYQTSANAPGKRLLDFGCGWGRIVRPFMRDFEFADLYAFEPDFVLCAVARTLNPYVTFLPGAFLRNWSMAYEPSGNLPEQFFDLMVGWSVFSHLSSEYAARWLAEAARVVKPGGSCVFTTWGDRFLRRLKSDAAEQAAGKEINWYHASCIAAGGSIERRLSEYERGEFVWFSGLNSTAYGEAFIGEPALKNLIAKHNLPFRIKLFDKTALPQDAFVLERL